MNTRRIGVIMGGASAEREVSLRSGEAVARALGERGHDVVRVVLGPGLDTLSALQGAEMDVAFLALHGSLGEDGCIQGVLEILGTPYTGSGVTASALAMDKLKAKELFRLHNVPTPPYYVVPADVSRQALLDAHGCFGFPVIVKPRRQGSSVGVARADTLDELVAAVGEAGRFDTSIIVERFIEAREIAVGILDGRVLGAVEIAPPAGIYDYRAKYLSQATQYFCPARLSDTLYRGVLNLAERAAGCLDTSGAVRVDLLVTEGQNEYVLEVNTLPGMTETSLLPKIAAGAGFDFGALCERILRSARLHIGVPRERSRSQLVPRRLAVEARPESGIVGLAPVRLAV